VATSLGRSVANRSKRVGQHRLEPGLELERLARDPLQRGVEAREGEEGARVDPESARNQTDEAGAARSRTSSSRSATALASRRVLRGTRRRAGGRLARRAPHRLDHVV